VVRVLFEHGAFTSADTLATAHALTWLSLALPAYVLVKALSPAFFAREDTITPLFATLKGFAVAIGAALVLGRLFGASGIAAAIALGAWSSALSLIRKGAATFGFSIDAEARRRLRRIVIAAILMGGALWLTAHAVLPWAADAHGLAQAAILGILVACGIAIYGLLLAWFGVVSWAEADGAVRRTPPRDLRR
jgi:putative peptidoglycan lipid II flippase